MAETEGIALREFGRQVGVSGEAIRKAIKSGRIPPAMVGQRPTTSGRLVPTICDPAGALRAFRANTNPMQQRAGANISAGKRAANGRPPLPGKEPSPQADDVGGEDDPAEVVVGDVPALSVSRAITESYKAKMARLDYEEKAGKLVNAEEFAKRFSTLVKDAMTSILSVPSKAKNRIPHLAVEDIEIMRQLLREALEEVARAGE